MSFSLSPLLPFLPTISVICLSLFCRFSCLSSAFPRPSILPFLFLSLFFPVLLFRGFVSTCCPSELYPHFLAFFRTLFLSPFRFSPSPWPSTCIACLRAHGGVRRAPSCLTQRSLLPASICRSSGPHRPAQRAGWGAGKRQSLPEPAQDWISGYTHTLTHIYLHSDACRQHNEKHSCMYNWFDSKFLYIQLKPVPCTVLK